MFDTARLVEGAQALGIALDDHQVDQFERYAALLEEWNTRMNLTRVPPEEVVPLHFLDSLTVWRAVDLGTVGRLLDVGTGAGFPGVPLKITLPDLEVALLDATRKRLTFLEAVIADLGLAGVTLHHARAEDAARLPAFRERYDCVAARAVARMAQLAAWTVPLTRVGGRVVALKSAGADDEVQEALPDIRRLGGALDRVVDLALPTTDLERKLVVVRKVRATPARYPERPGPHRRSA